MEITPPATREEALAIAANALRVRRVRSQVAEKAYRVHREMRGLHDYFQTLTGVVQAHEFTLSLSPRFDLTEDEIEAFADAQPEPPGPDADPEVTVWWEDAE